MARVVRQSKQQTEPEPPASGNRLQWILGMVFMLIACVASGVLALKQLGWLGESLPGCGPQSGCGAVTNSVWGKIPGIMWPVSYVGFAYFVGMLVAWGTNAMQGTPNTLRWIARLSALCSFSFMVVMVVMDSFCVYCITAHVANFAFLLLLFLYIFSIVGMQVRVHDGRLRAWPSRLFRHRRPNFDRLPV